MAPSKTSQSSDRAVAQHLCKALGGAPRVVKCRSFDDQKEVDLLCCTDAPQTGVSSYATLNLGNLAPTAQGADGPFSTELVGACASKDIEFSNVIGHIAFNAMDGASLWPGSLHKNVVAEYYPLASCRHCVLGYPFLWGAGIPASLKQSDTERVWLQVIPITDAEARFLNEHGYDALEDLFLRAQIDVYNLNRACALA